jgi:outer membrane immunogenic protein
VKKLLLAVSALALSAATASAADLAARPYVKAPPLPAVYDWSGFYIGVNGGYGWGRDSFADPTTGLTDGSHNSNGAIAGGQLGWRAQTGAFVWGVDFQGGWADLKGSNAGVFNPALTFNSKTNGLASFALEAGYAFNNVLLYARGGAGWASNTYSSTVTATGLGVGSQYEGRWGGLLGAGLEYGITQNWTVGVEYNHYFLGSLNEDIGPALAPEHIGQSLDTVTAKINYKFGGPIVARY